MIASNDLTKLCRLVRYNILTSTTAAGSGHPTSSLSAVELATTVFFKFFKKGDKFILSKGHASPLLYSIYQAAGLISRDELMTLRQFHSPLEGHPTPRLSYIDVATGSLGQGLSVGLGMALGMKLEVRSTKSETNANARKFGNSKIVSSFDIRSSDLPRVFVLLGDSEIAEGQNYEAMEIASYYKLDNLIAILDVNRLGQRGETTLGWDIDKYAKRVEAFGWNVITIDDGHNLEKVHNAFQSAASGDVGAAGIDIRQTSDDLPAGRQGTSSENANFKRPTMLIAKTVKGKGISFIENQNGWHGKTLSQDELKKALAELGEVDLTVEGGRWKVEMESGKSKMDEPSNINLPSPSSTFNNLSSYKVGELVSTREAYGRALASLGKIYPNLIALDAEVSNSTFSNTFQKEFPDRFFEMFIAEQNMVSAALGISKVGYIPFVSTFAAFLTRAFDQIRMAQYSQANLKLVGSHAGVSIGSDGPSQMALEDLAMMRSILHSTVLYPADAVSTAHLVQIMAKNEGISYLRTTREKTPVIYSPEEEFKIGGSSIHKVKIQNSKFKILIIAAGITLHEALKAQKKLADEGIEAIVMDCYSVKPIDHLTIGQFSHLPIIVVEDHYPAGGLGEAVLTALGNKKSEARNSKFQTNSNLENSKLVSDFDARISSFTHLCVRKTPRSGTPEELLHYEEIDSDTIIKTVKSLL